MKEYCKISADSTTENLSNFTTAAKNCALPATITMTSSFKEQQQEHSQTSNGDASVPDIAVSNIELMEIDENITSTEMMNSNNDYMLTDVPELIKREIRQNEYWYLLDKNWYDTFLSYLENRMNLPTKISNSSLITPLKNVHSQLPYGLNRNCAENEDFILVPEEAWNLLVNNFGTEEEMNGYPLRCPVIKRTETFLQVEIFPLEFRILLYGSKEDKLVRYSRNNTLKDVIDEMKKIFRIPEDTPIQLWINATLLIPRKDGFSDFSSSVNIDQPLLDIMDLEAPNSVLTIEIQNNDKTWPSSKTKLGAITRSKLVSGHATQPPGVCGLSNLGNTCFMNSALQCLSNIACLTKYFLEDRHLADINPENPLGMRGLIAGSYSELIKVIWSGCNKHTAPREFKSAVTQFAPQFTGMNHHDCQELMAFLLDGLHEDLNRVKVKPYIEMKNDIESRPDEIVAAEAWKNYKLRNDSIIVDIFHAQLKSTLVCPECELVSVTFDPFCYLTLPLPYRNEKCVNVLFVPALSKRPTTTCALSTSINEFISVNRNYTSTMSVRSTLLENVMVPKSGCALDVSVAVAKYLNECINDNDNCFNRTVDPKKLVVTNVNEWKMLRMYEPSDHSVTLENLVIYELDDLPTSVNPDAACQTRSYVKFSGHHIPVFIRKIHSDQKETIIGRPFFINVKCLTYENVHEAIFKELITLVNKDKVPNFIQEMEKQFVEEKYLFNSNDDADDGSDVDENYNHNISNSGTDNDEEIEEFDNMINEKYGDIMVKQKTNSYQITYATYVNLNASVPIKLGDRLDPNIENLSIKIHHSIITKYFPNDINSFGFAKFSSLFSHFIRPITNNVLTLKECINQFTLTEKLGENDPWFCPRCKKHQMASKKFDIWSLPNDLIIHLKRFSYSRIHREKLNVQVEFPIENLDMTQFVLHNPNNETFIYDLIGVSNHYGEMGAGHYNTFAKNFLNNRWYLFDDSSVDLIDKTNVITKAAYVLFYQRKQTNNNNNNNDNNNNITNNNNNNNKPSTSTPKETKPTP